MKHRVSLNFSEGDNIQYDQLSLRSEKLWSNPLRGSVPMGWTCSPMLLDAGPGLLNYFYRTATPNDVLICGPSGAGYTNIGYWKSNSPALKRYNEITNAYKDLCAQPTGRYVRILIRARNFGHGVWAENFMWHIPIT